MRFFGAPKAYGNACLVMQLITDAGIKGE